MLSPTLIVPLTSDFNTALPSTVKSPLICKSLSNVDALVTRKLSTLNLLVIPTGLLNVVDVLLNTVELPVTFKFPTILVSVCIETGCCVSM